MNKSRQKPTVYLGTDHAAFSLKEQIRAYLMKAGYKVVDMGAMTFDPKDDYPDFVIPATESAMASRGRAVAIVMGGTGIGECIAANKVLGARAALVHDLFTARATRTHNDSNVLCLGARTATGDPKLAKRIVKTWLETPFSGDTRHKRRLKKLKNYEKSTGSVMTDKKDHHSSLGADCRHDH